MSDFVQTHFCRIAWLVFGTIGTIAWTLVGWLT